jgi:hypothetical protein
MAEGTKSLPKNQLVAFIYRLLIETGKTHFITIILSLRWGHFHQAKMTETLRNFAVILNSSVRHWRLAQAGLR